MIKHNISKLVEYSQETQRRTFTAFKVYIVVKTTRVPEPEQLGPGRYRQPRAGHGWFPAEQSRA